MMNFLEFTFQDGWHFGGIVLLLYILLQGIAECFEAIASIKQAK